MDIYISGKKTNIKNTKLNRFLLGGLIVKRDAKTLYLAEKNIVNINAWINPDRTVNNVGDYLSIVVVDYLCTQNGIELVDSTLETETFICSRIYPSRLARLSNMGFWFYF